jgi:1-acyl-sn-glycerol-3-phosphate acyltransferase
MPEPARDGAAELTLTRLVEVLLRPGLDPSDLGNRDPAFIRAVLPYLDALTTPYFRPEYEGAENIPRTGPFIAVANHNGGPMLADLWTALVYWEKRIGPEFPIYCLAHDMCFRLRFVGNFFARLGALAARRENAEKVLAAGGGLLLFPGGELDCYRSFWDRNRIDLRGRTGFIKLALRHGAPIVPYVNIGGHETCITLLSSERLARWTGIEWLTRVKTVPVSVGLPWGVWATGFVPFLPLPAKFAYRMAEPIPVPHDPERADDEATVQTIYRQVSDVMQSMLDDLAQRRTFPVIG